MVPKVEGPESVKDYRPIILQLAYTVIAKALSNRIKEVIPSIILGNQCAFVRGTKYMTGCLLQMNVLRIIG